MSVAEPAVPTLTLGVRLELARRHAGLEQSQMAELLGVTAASVSNYELDKRKPRDVLDLVKKWSEHTGISEAWLLGLGPNTTYGAPSGPPRARLRSVAAPSRSAR